MTRGSTSSSPTRPHRTNINEPPNTFTSSRGHLVSSFLASPLSPSLADDAQRIAPPDARYAGFNLLLLAAAPAHSSPSFSFDALFMTNRGGGGPISFRALTDAQRHRGGLSNGVDGDGADEWPKVQHGVRALDALLGALPPDISADQLAERLFDLLTWVYDIRTYVGGANDSLNVGSCMHRWRSSQPPRDRSESRNAIQVDPLHDANGYYGTRLSTVVLVKRSGEVVFTERDRWNLTAQGRPILADPSSQRVFRFKMECSE